MVLSSLDDDLGSDEPFGHCGYGMSADSVGGLGGDLGVYAPKINTPYRFYSAGLEYAGGVPADRLNIPPNLGGDMRGLGQSTDLYTANSGAVSVYGSGGPGSFGARLPRPNVQPTLPGNLRGFGETGLPDNSMPMLDYDAGDTQVRNFRAALTNAGLGETGLPPESQPTLPMAQGIIADSTGSAPGITLPPTAAPLATPLSGSGGTLLWGAGTALAAYLAFKLLTH